MAGRNLWQGPGSRFEKTSYAAAVRGEEGTTNLVPEKKVTMVLTFVGGDEQWTNLATSMEVARLWVKTCESIAGTSRMKREVAGFEMEVKIEDQVEEPGVAAVALHNQRENREHENVEVGTGGADLLECQRNVRQLQIQILNSLNELGDQQSRLEDCNRVQGEEGTGPAGVDPVQDLDGSTEENRIRQTGTGQGVGPRAGVVARE